MSANPNISSAKEAADLIASLAISNRDEVCPTIIEILSSLEAPALTTRTVLEIAEALRAPADDVILRYRFGYVDRALPLGEGEAKRFGDVIALIAAFEAVYQRIFETALAAPPGAAARKDLAESLQRGMDCLVAQMIEYYRARQNLSPALWNRLQQCIQVAVREKVDAVEVADPLNPRGTATPHATYGRALLLSIAQAGAMTHRSLEATLILTAVFAHLIESTMLDRRERAEAGRHGGIGAVEVQRTGRIRVVVAGGVTHLVNTTRIDTALDWSIQRLREGAGADQIGLGTVAHADLNALLPRLRRIWCGGGEIREAPRRALEEASVVAIGFREIYEFATQKSSVTVPKEFDVYQAGDGLPTHAQRLRTLPRDNPANPIESWQTMDYSASGMRARRSRAGAQVRRGQLLAIAFHGMQDNFGFALAEVRWLQQFAHDDGGGIAAGVRFVSSNAQVAMVRAFGLEREQYQTVAPAFVLDQPTPPQVVLAAGWFRPGRNLDLWYQERMSFIKLTELRVRGADHEIADYEVVERPYPWV